MGAESQETFEYRQLSASERTQRLLQIAARQHQLATTEQLLGLGFGDSTIHRHMVGLRLFPMRHGVHSVAPPPHPDERILLAAVLCCGPHAVASDWSAAWLARLTPTLTAPIHVASPSGRGRSRRGLAVHQYALDPRDRTRRRGIPCTTTARTLLDIAARTTTDDLERMLLDADSRRILEVPRLLTLVEQHEGKPGIRNLRTVLGEERRVVRSDKETTMLQACRRADLPLPQVNKKIILDGRSLEVDFVWQRERLAVELDGYAFHGGRTQLNRDRERDQVLAMAGWRVVRFTRDHLVADWRSVTDRIRTLLTIETAHAMVAADAPEEDPAEVLP